MVSPRQAVFHLKITLRGVDPPVSMAGAWACPPEDCGGPWGYEELLKAIADRRHPEHDQLVAWAGKGFDPERLDLAAYTVECQR
jgi:hypothetical protein